MEKEESHEEKINFCPGIMRDVFHIYNAGIRIPGSAERTAAAHTFICNISNIYNAGIHIQDNIANYIGGNTAPAARM